MKTKELSAEEMKAVNGGYDDAATNPMSDDSQPDNGTYPTSDGVGETEESTYGPKGPVRHYFP